MMNYIIIYAMLGLLFGFSVEILMHKYDLAYDVTFFERFLWLVFWPLFLLIFIYGMLKK